MLSVRKNPDCHDKFGASVAHTVRRLTGDPQKLSASGDAAVSSEARREAVELRDVMQSLQNQGDERSVLKLSFLWHQDVANLFEDIVQEGCSYVGVNPRALIRDMATRAEVFAAAIGSRYVIADLLCSRFRADSAPVHVDYPEFLKADESVLRMPDRRALSFVMPYVGQGTQYLEHPRELVEGDLRPYVIKESSSVLGIEHRISRHPLAAGCSWRSTSDSTYSIHKNGLSIHRAPASDDFRLLLALDACVSGNTMGDPITEVRDRVFRNIRVIRGAQSKIT